MFFVIITYIMTGEQGFQVKKIVLIVAAAVTVLAVAVGVTLLIRGHSVSEWQEKYDLGIRYLNEGKYDEAVIAFTAAIDIDPKPQAYANRARDGGRLCCHGRLRCRR